MSKNLKSLICCILALLFVSATVIAVFADSNDLFAAEEAVSVTEEDVTVEDTTVEATTEATTAEATSEEDTTVEATTEAPTEEVSEEESETQPDKTYRLGDVNFDGKITAADARLALRFSARVQVPTADEFIVANVILDNKITSQDARLILRVAARIITEADLGIAA